MKVKIKNISLQYADEILLNAPDWFNENLEFDSRIQFKAAKIIGITSESVMMLVWPTENPPSDEAAIGTITLTNTGDDDHVNLRISFQDELDEKLAKIPFTESVTGWAELGRTEDWWANWMGFFVLLLVAVGMITTVPKPKTWKVNPFSSVPIDMLLPLLVMLIGIGVLSAIALLFMKEKPKLFLAGFPLIFILALLANIVSQQATIKAYGLGYAFWALILGLLISNTIGIPNWLKPSIKTEMYIKTGLVLLGATVLFSKIVKLGLPGLMVAWIVTPIVIIFMYLFGTKTLRMLNKKLAIIIAAATSVCGVSAAIATAAACRAKKDDLTLAVGMTLIFTVLMMVFMPIGIKAVNMDVIVGGAWMGGTIDSTGAVVAAGALLGDQARDTAAVVKMIQNILIGLLAFCVAVFWVTKVERDPDSPKPNAMEIWYRLPKFVIGFVVASLLFSFLLLPIKGEDAVDVLNSNISKIMKWYFCLAFICIGLDSNFKELAEQLVGGKPLILYVVGQSFNLALTLLIAWLVFGGILFARPTF